MQILLKGVEQTFDADAALALPGVRRVLEVDTGVAAGRDPLELRLSLLGDAPHHKQALELTIREAGWNAGQSAGVHQGPAVHQYDETSVGTVAEVEVHLVDTNRRPRGWGSLPTPPSESPPHPAPQAR